MATYGVGPAATAAASADVLNGTALPVLSSGMQQHWWIWASGALIALILEAVVGGSFIFVFFALGAAVTAPLVGFGFIDALWQAALCFSAVTALSLLASRRRLLAWRDAPKALSDMAGLVGSIAVVEAAMAPRATGAVQHRGTSWMAHNVGTAHLPPGARCRVVRVDNLTLWVDSAPHQEQL